MRYTVIITRQGVPHETWEAESDTPDQAVHGCRQQRQQDGEHWPSDTYEAGEAEADDDDALTHAYASAMDLCPALREVVESRHVPTPASLPAWLGIDAMPLSIGGAP